MKDHNKPLTTVIYHRGTRQYYLAETEKPRETWGKITMGKGTWRYVGEVIGVYDSYADAMEAHLQHEEQ